MDNQLATTNDRGIYTGGESVYTARERDQLRALQGIGEASDSDLDMLFNVAQRTGLDPFIREIYLVGRKTKTGGYRGEPERWETKWTVQAGIDGFRKVTRRWAESKGLFVSIGAPIFYDDSGDPHKFWLHKWNKEMAACEVTITAGNNVATHLVQWDEYAQHNSYGNLTRMWQGMGSTMIAKCAEAGAHRKICSLTSGMYVAEEMLQADSQPVQQQATREPVQNQQVQARGVNALEQGMNAYTGRNQRERVEVTAPKPEQEPTPEVIEQEPVQEAEQGALQVTPPEVQELLDEIARIRTVTSPKFNEINDKAMNQFGNGTPSHLMVNNELQKKFHELEKKQ